MGAWGHNTFENDCALDWVGDFERQQDKLKFLGQTFQAALDQNVDYLEVDEGSCVLAAADVLAALQGRPNPTLPEGLATWVAQNPTAVSDEQIQLALQAIAVTKNVEVSEIAELWEDDKKWDEAVINLIDRLSQSKAALD